MYRKKLSEWMKSKKFLRIAVITGVSAIVLILISSYFDFGSTEKEVSAAERSSSLKQQLLEIISHIDGVGEAEVFLTLDNNGENVYLKNSDTKTKSIEPTVRGVVIVCDGGDDPIVVMRVLDAVTRSLSISSDKVCITKLSKR